MAQSTQVVQTKMLDYFFSLRKLHTVRVPADRELETGALYEYECLFRPDMPMLPQSITSVVQAAIDTDRAVELDGYIVATILARIARIEAARHEAGDEPLHFAHQPDAVEPARPGLRAGRGQRAGPCRRPRSAPDHDRVHRAAVRLRRRRPAATRPGAAPARLRLRGRRRRRRLRQLRADRRAPPDASSRSTATSSTASPATTRSRRCRGVRLVRPPDRRAAARRGDRASGRPGRPDRRSASSSGRATCSGARPSSRAPPRKIEREGGPRSSRSVARGRPVPGPPHDPARAGALAYHRGHDQRPARPHPGLPRRPPLRDHRHDRSRRHAAPGRHLVHARRRRARHQQPGRPALAVEPAARPAASRSRSPTATTAIAGSG